MSASERLVHLLDLANQGPAMRAALAEEVAELLTAWPDDCPVEMRVPCEALLARAACELDADSKARLRIRLCADPQLAARAVPRETPKKNLVTLARQGADMCQALAEALNLDNARADDLLSDKTGHALAMACKELELDRASFSALAILATPAANLAGTYARLAIFDAVTAADATRLLRAWRSATPEVAA